MWSSNAYENLRARANIHTYTQFLSLRIDDRFVFDHESCDLSKGICMQLWVYMFQKYCHLVPKKRQLLSTKVEIYGDPQFCRSHVM